MTINGYFLPVPPRRPPTSSRRPSARAPSPTAARPRVILIGFDGCQSLDVAGPAEVFAGAGRRRGQPVYDVVLASTAGRPVATAAGYALDAQGRRYAVTFLINHPKSQAGSAAIDALLVWVAQRRVGEKIPVLENE